MDRSECRQADEKACKIYVLYDARTLERLGEQDCLPEYGDSVEHLVVYLVHADHGHWYAWDCQTLTFEPPRWWHASVSEHELEAMIYGQG